MYKIIKSKISNQGLMANKDIKNNTKIIEYRGRLISKKETETNEKFDNDKHIYLFNRRKVSPEAASIHHRSSNRACVSNCRICK